MKCKKILATLAATVLCVGAFSVTAFAGQHRGGGNTCSATGSAAAASYTECPYTNCTSTGNHSHKGACYSASGGNGGTAAGAANGNAQGNGGCANPQGQGRHRR